MRRELISEKCLMAFTALAVLAFGGMETALAHEGEDHSADTAPPVLSAQGKRVVAALEGYAAAVETGDIDKVEQYVVTGAGFSSLEGTFEDLGWDSYRKHLGDEMPMFQDTSYHLSNIRPFVRGDLAYATMDYLMNVTIESDQFEGGRHELAMKGKATMVLAQSNKAWKIRHIHTSREKAEDSGSGSSQH